VHISKFCGSVAFALVVSGSGVVAQDADVGGQIYGQYCATCHGVDATGGGPLTELLLEKPSDLTLLAQNNDGVFPMLELIHIIDGRTGLRAHGGSMPTYGEVFTAEAQSDMLGDYHASLVARGRIMSLALYLESIQQ
jgi:mono/diheme cytochrome c family protein